VRMRTCTQFCDVVWDCVSSYARKKGEGTDARKVRLEDYRIDYRDRRGGFQILHSTRKRCPHDRKRVGKTQGGNRGGVY